VFAKNKPGAVSVSCEKQSHPAKLGNRVFRKEGEFNGGRMKKKASPLLPNVVKKGGYPAGKRTDKINGREGEDKGSGPEYRRGGNKTWVRIEEGVTVKELGTEILFKGDGVK